MRQFIPIIFVLALTLPFVGVYGWLKFEKSAVKKSVKHRLMEGIPKEELVQFTFALKDTATLLDWKHGKEFEYRGEMYDIVTRNYKVDSVVYDLWWDHEETALNKKLATLTNQLLNRNPDEQSRRNYLAHIQKTMYNEVNSIIVQPLSPLSLKSTTFTELTNLYRSISLQPISPPPQYLVLFTT
ncbi:hypothetical protein CW751_02400 [Brumimicrobium salinarum]|uniref:Uncharacterized protein n=1 Tax=Brumimicrobium salinarum TaxID=2058658 RepID=A0A2I0R6I7_9FLAO|nr:hypothetical protein [Brumimicrobium salinarum]PKR82202.1 hypothetical protein CW751_02400 [Brumimicrobium salinarum]